MAAYLQADAILPAPRAAYVHVPFCRHRCGYCNFSVLTGRDDLADAFLSALEIELSQLDHPRPVDTIFIGGGTPTHLPPEWLDRFLTLVTHWFPLAESGEFSMEANPRDIEIEKLSVAAGHGVNRISLGVQSFDSGKLKVLERDHDHDIAANAVHQAVESIGNVSIDLIFAAPGETLGIWQADLDTALSLPIKHVSTYGLTYEKGSNFWGQRNRGDIKSVDEELELEMYKASIAALTAAGMKHYEVSNFAFPDHQCRHNITYWKGLGWYGAGPSAARFVDGRRETNHRSATTYIKLLREGKSPTCESEILDNEQLIRERVAFGLRMLNGVDLSTAGPIALVKTLLDETLSGLATFQQINRNGNHIYLTTKGLFVSDSVLAELL